MNLHVEFPGQNTRFEGDRSIPIKGLPLGAAIRHATVTLTPVSAPGQEMFVEELRFSGNQGDFGCTKTPGMGFVEVDFHTRRTLTAVYGSSLPGTLLQVDLGGGVFMEINQYGALRSPEDADDELFTLGNDNILPGLTVSRFSLRQRQSVNPKLLLDVNQISVRTSPTNISLGLGQLPPFWTHVGEMTQPQTSSDFAAVLQLFLNDAAVVDGNYVLPLVVHSDALTRLNVVVDIEFINQVSALPTDVSEAALPFTHDSTAQIDSQLLQVSLPVGAQVLPGETSVRVLGAFDESRVLVGPTGPVEVATAVAITPHQSQAQPLLFDKSLTATAVDLLLTSISRAAILQVNFLGDGDGKPFGKFLLNSPVTLTLDRDVAGTPTWVSVPLPQEFEFQQDKRIWLVIQVTEGEAAWSSEIAPTDNVGLQNSSTGGLAWRLTQAENINGRLAAFYRLRHTPEQFEMPLEVMVGAGDTAVRVGLERFQPLGRIDFNIDIPEFADAINQVAAATGAALCPQGEQLRNENFNDWTRSGNTPHTPKQLNVSGDAAFFSMHMSPKGNKLYLTGVNDMLLGTLDFPCHAFQNILSFPTTVSEATISAHAFRLQNQRTLLMTINQTEQRAYLGANTNLVVIDPLHGQFVAQRAIILDFRLSALTLSSDGARLFMTGHALEGNEHQLVAVETAVLEQNLLTSPENINLSDLNPIRATLPQPPTALALTPAGDEVFVTLASENEYQAGQVRAFAMSPTAFHLLGQIAVGDMPLAIALTPNGQLALVVDHTNDQVNLIDTQRLLNVQNINLPKIGETAVEPVAVVIAPDGTFAYTANAAGTSVTVLDLQTRRAVQTLPLPLAGTAISITPQGDALYVIVADDYAELHSLVQIPLGQKQPDSWQLTSGFVTPLCAWDAFKLTAGLGPLTAADRAKQPARPTALSQVIPATGGCVYEFSFWGTACDLDAVAEIIWMGADCALQKTDRIPIVMADIPTARIITAGQRQERSCLETFTPDLQLHRARLAAPAGAVQAEIRFLVPPKVTAAVDAVTFQVTTNTLNNQDMRFVEDGALPNWRLKPETAVGFTPIIATDNVQLQNSSSERVAVAQDFVVTAGQPFELTFEGFVAAQLATRESPRVEVHWLAADETLTDEINELAVTAVTSEKHVLNGTVPTDAAAAELHLVIPPSTTLALSQIAFQPLEIIQVPINFIAQSPGAMTISDFRVAYDLPQGSVRPPLPATGLCKPTPPGRAPGAKPGDTCVCPWCPQPCAACADETAVPDTATATLKQNGQSIRVEPQRRRALSAGPRLIEVADSLVVGSLPLAPTIQPIEAEITALLPATESAWIALAGELSAAAIPLKQVKGIGPARTQALAAMNIHTLPQLAAANPASLAAALDFVTERNAANYIDAAQTLLLDPTLRQAPLLSCVMPTSDRRHFVPKAIEYFLRQEYPQTELIIVDDGIDAIVDLVPDDARIHYLRLEKKATIGTKRNLGFAEANGQLFANWDDDVWTAEWRLSYQAAALLHNKADICGLQDLLHFDVRSGQAWYSMRPPGKRPWMAGSALLFTRNYWHKNPFPDQNLGEDIQFVRSDPTAKIVPLQATTFQVDIIHGANSSPKNSASPLWYPFTAEEIHALMGADWQFYQEISA